ncbi:MAG: phosphoenolpyruvate-protein phosphotransferase [Firmicutes bacterium]|nr:phosphoenolpyruvate-protein phosphotransferase [Bacillota bacterium]
MKVGIPASPGYAIGRALIRGSYQSKIIQKKISNVISEKERLYKAIKKTRQQLTEIRDRVTEDLGEGNAAVFEGHLVLLEDPEFIGAVESNIESNIVNAEKAMQEVMDMYISIFDSMQDDYMKARSADIKDVGTRILSNLLGMAMGGLETSKKDTIVVAHDMTPSETAQLNQGNVIAFVTDMGAKTSHSSIMARSMGIPSVTGLNDITKIVKNGDVLIVDGVLGQVLINPDIVTLNEYRQKKEAYEKEKEELKSLKNITVSTKSGKKIRVGGNIGKSQEVDFVLENGGDEIGLFRTEILYLDRDKLPTEKEQFEEYRSVVQKMQGKAVIIRTLDIGGDKHLSYLHIPEETNPFLGYRAVRLCLDRKDIFKVQLRALLRASAYGNLKIMIPMISIVEEFLEVKAIIEECKRQLDNEYLDYDHDIEVGIMVEVPAAAVCADELAKHADFLSIGTNDLIQYTFAADRGNENVSYLYNPMHPAILRLIKMTIDAAHKEGKWCGMCGEMAADEEAIRILIEYGLDEFSMNYSSILKVKKLILEM